MVGAGETFLPAFALALGSSAITAGLMAALPFLIGSTLQLAAPRLVAKIGSLRKWVVTLGVLQAFSFLPLVAFALQGKGVPDWALHVVAAFYWTFGLASGPAWNSWMTALVPSVVRPRYFAWRNHIGQLGLVIGLVLGGVILHLAKMGGWEFKAFAGIFLVSGLVRAGSALCLRRQSEGPAEVSRVKPLSIGKVFERFRRGREASLLGFLLVFAVAVNLASPFFNPFMIKQLSLSYGSYMALIATSFIAKIVVFSFLSRAARKMDSTKLMRVGLIGASISPAFWVISTNYFFLMGAQLASGTFWALYELGLTLVLFRVIRDEERTSILSVFNFVSALMVLAGTLLGGKLLSMFGESSQTYFMIFGLSAAARLLTLKIFDRAVERMETRGLESENPDVGEAGAPSDARRGGRGRRRLESAS
jgi:MFS family permease